MVRTEAILGSGTRTHQCSSTRRDRRQLSAGTDPRCDATDGGYFGYHWAGSGVHHSSGRYLPHCSCVLVPFPTGFTDAADCATAWQDTGGCSTITATTILDDNRATVAAPAAGVDTDSFVSELSGRPTKTAEFEFTVVMSLTSDGAGRCSDEAEIAPALSASLCAAAQRSFSLLGYTDPATQGCNRSSFVIEICDDPAESSGAPSVLFCFC